MMHTPAELFFLVLLMIVLWHSWLALLLTHHTAGPAPVRVQTWNQLSEVCVQQTERVDAASCSEEQLSLSTVTSECVL